MSLKYTIGSILAFPLLPILYFQAKRIKNSVPVLPEATGTEGKCNTKSSDSKEIKLLVIGESTIAGVGVKTHEEGFSGTLAKELSSQLGKNISWKVYARSGYTAKRVTYKILPKITESEADLIVVGIGGNDAFTLNRPSKWKQQVRTLIVKLKEQFPDAPIVFCNMPPIKEFPAFTSLIKLIVGNLVEILGKELMKVTREFENVHYHNEVISLESWNRKFGLGFNQQDYFSDGVHPSKTAYQTWAKDIAEMIANIVY